jgi:hypothetical protein
VKEAEDEDDDPAGGEDWDDGCHAREEGLDGLSNVRVFYFSGLADGLDGIFGHCLIDNEHDERDLTTS